MMSDPTSKSLSLITFYCPHCGQKLKISGKYSGKDCRCSRCQQDITIPSASEEVLGDSAGIKFRCRGCSHKISVPVEYAGKRVRCPHCKRVICVPQPRIDPRAHPEPVSTGGESGDSGYEPAPSLSELISSEGSSFASASAIEPTTGEEDIWSDVDFDEACPSEEIPIAEQDGGGDGVNDAARIACSRCNSRVDAESEFCTVCGARIQTFEARGAARRGSTAGTFTKDLFRVFSPAKTVSENITLVILVVVSLFAEWPLPGIIFFYAQYAASAYIGAYLLNLLLETANGNNHLPSSFEITSFWDDVARPFWLLVVCTVYAILPIFVMFFAYLHFFRPDSVEAGLTGMMTILVVSVGIGLFFWPMIVLNVALRDSFLVRPDRILFCIIRTIGPYLICCVFVYASYFAWYFYGTIMASHVEDSSSLIQAIMILVNLCTRIFAMRVIGMFYRHYEDRLDW